MTPIRLTAIGASSTAKFNIHGLDLQYYKPYGLSFNYCLLPTAYCLLPTAYPYMNCPRLANAEEGFTQQTGIFELLAIISCSLAPMT